MLTIGAIVQLFRIALPVSPIERRQTVFSREIERIERRREAWRERRRALWSIIILCSRKRVAALELQTVRQTTIGLQHQRVILGRNGVANLENVAERSVW